MHSEHGSHLNTWPLSSVLSQNYIVMTTSCDVLTVPLAATILNADISLPSLMPEASYTSAFSAWRVGPLSAAHFEVRLRVSAIDLIVDNFSRYSTHRQPRCVPT